MDAASAFERGCTRNQVNFCIDCTGRQKPAGGNTSPVSETPDRPLKVDADAAPCEGGIDRLAVTLEATDLTGNAGRRISTGISSEIVPDNAVPVTTVPRPLSVKSGRSAAENASGELGLHRQGRIMNLLLQEIKVKAGPRRDRKDVRPFEKSSFRESLISSETSSIQSLSTRSALVSAMNRS
jgi:hypothetical protein